MEQETENKQESRKGTGTAITSVSLTTEFRELMKEYNISPTWAIRKGVAIELYEMGIPKYQSATNRKRQEIVNNFLKLNAVSDIIPKLAEFEKAAKELREALEVVT